MPTPSKNIRAERIKGTLDASEFDISGSLSITGSLNVTGGITGSYTGSFVGDGSQLTGVTSDINFANTNLTFTGNRTHDLNGFDLGIEQGGNINLFADGYDVGMGLGYSIDREKDFFLYTDDGEINFTKTNPAVFNLLPTSAYLELAHNDGIGLDTPRFLSKSPISDIGNLSSTLMGLFASITNRLSLGYTNSFNVTSGDVENVVLIGSNISQEVESNKVYIKNQVSIGATIISGSLTVSNSLNTNGAKIRNQRTITLTDADYSTSPSNKINADDDIILVINNTTFAPIAGSANFGISSFLASPSGRCVEIVCIKAGFSGIILSDPTMVGLRLFLNDQSQAGGTRQVCSAVGESITLMSYQLDASGSAWGNGY